MDIVRKKTDARAGRGGVRCYCCGGLKKDRRLTRAVRRVGKQEFRARLREGNAKGDVMKKTYILKRDGEEVARGDEFELLKYMHRKHSFSMDWACKHEGYSVEVAQA